MNNLTVQQLKDRIDWLLANTTLMPNSQTDIAAAESVVGVGGRMLETTDRDLVDEIERLRCDLRCAEDDVRRLEAEIEELSCGA